MRKFVAGRAQILKTINHILMSSERDRDDCRYVQDDFNLIIKYRTQADEILKN